MNLKKLKLNEESQAFYIFFIFLLDADSSLSQSKLKELISSSASKSLEQEEGGPGPVDSLRSALEFISQQVASLVQVLQDYDYEAGMPIKPEEKVIL